jgi:hypothetical protein
MRKILLISLLLGIPVWSARADAVSDDLSVLATDSGFDSGYFDSNPADNDPIAITPEPNPADNDPIAATPEPSPADNDPIDGAPPPSDPGFLADLANDLRAAADALLDLSGLDPQPAPDPLQSEL